LGKPGFPEIFAERRATSGGWRRWQSGLLAKGGFWQRCEHLQEATVQPKSESTESESILVITADYDCCPSPSVSICLK